MIQCFIKVAQRVPVVKNMVIKVIATLLKPMRGREACLAPETTPLVTTCIKQKQIQKILQDGGPR